MGLKSGTRDSGIDADEESESAEEIADTTVDGGTVEATETGETERTDSTPSKDEIPYLYRRDSVNGSRKQTPFFLREDTLDAEEEFLRTLEDELGEDVYKSDAREAAQVLAFQHPQAVCEILRSWGYDLD